MDNEKVIETDESLVSSEMLANMVSNEATDPDIPSQEAGFSPTEGLGVNDGDR